MKRMKTITLDDEAYALLKRWKTSGKESFSMVVKRVVPVPGTLGALLNCVEEAGTAHLAGNKVMEETINQRPVARHDPWT
jgi:negative regulator of replication initiation